MLEVSVKNPSGDYVPMARLRQGQPMGLMSHKNAEAEEEVLLFGIDNAGAFVQRSRLGSLQGLSHPPIVPVEGCEEVARLRHGQRHEIDVVNPMGLELRIRFSYWRDY